MTSPGQSPLDAARALFGEQLEDLAGGVVSGEIPLTVAVINRLIARKIATSPSSPVISAELESHETETFVVRLRVRGPLPPLRIDLRIDREPRLPSDPTLAMHWKLSGLGPFAILAAPIASYFRVLPRGVRLESNRLLLDVHELLRAQGFGEAVPLLTGLRVITREGRFVIQFELRR